MSERYAKCCTTACQECDGTGFSGDWKHLQERESDDSWERERHDTGFRYIYTSERLLFRIEEEFYADLKRTPALEAAVAAIQNWDKTPLIMSSTIIPFDKTRGKKMSNLAETKIKELIPTPTAQPATDMSNPFASLANFEAAQRMAKALGESSLIPKEYQKNIPNCLIALEISQRLRASVLMVMQNLYIVHGKPGWSAQYIISAINSCGKFSPLRFEMDEQKTECTAYAVELKTGEILRGTKITMKMAHEEGWVNKTGSKWKTMPEQMLRYRAASFFGKIYAPEILMGFQTTEEIEDMQAFSNAKEVKAEKEVKSEVAKVVVTDEEPKEITPEPTPAPLPPAAKAGNELYQELPWDKYLNDPMMVK